MKVVYETSLGTPDDEALQDAMLQRAAEKEPDYFGAALSQVPTTGPCAASHPSLHVLALVYTVGLQSVTPGSALRSARLPIKLIGFPINYANRLIGSPMTFQSTGAWPARCRA